MAQALTTDGLLVTWGDRLFYPGNRRVANASAKLQGGALAQRAAWIRGRIAATVQRRAPQVMVKVTGGGRGVRAIAAHFRYISKNGRLTMEDDRGETLRGPQAVRDQADEWRFGGSFIPEEGGDAMGTGGNLRKGRREAYNLMLSMPRGTDPLAVQWAAREFARTELADHPYVMVLHDHQANPHVHLSVRAESREGRRLNPRKADLQRWRETFAQKLREQGIEAEATRRSARGWEPGRARRSPELWELKAGEEGRLRKEWPPDRLRGDAAHGLSGAVEAWSHLAEALSASVDPADRRLAVAVSRLVLNPVPPVPERGGIPQQDLRVWKFDRSPGR